MSVLDYLLGGKFAGTPPFNPNSPVPGLPGAQQPQQGGGLKKGVGLLDQFLNKPGGAMLMNLLAQSGYSTTPQSPFGAVGRAYQATQQQQQAQGFSDLQKELIRSRIGLQDAQAEKAGRRTSVGQDGAIGKLSPTMYTPESVQSFNESVMAGTPDYSLLEFRPELRIFTRPDGSIGVTDTGSGAAGGGVGRPDVVTPDEAISGAAGRKAAEVEAGQDPARERSLPKSLLTIDQTINDVDEVLAGLKSGDLRTGSIIQGKLYALTPLGEKLRSLGNLKVIDLISSATFGQLSEGERKFLNKIAFGLERTEKFNEDELNKFRDIMVKVREIEAKDAERLGVGDQDVDAIADKYR